MQHDRGSISLTQALALTALTPVLRYVLHANIFEANATLLSMQPLATNLLATTHEELKTGSLPPALDRKRSKLTESLWKSTAYTVLVLFGIFALHDQDWALQSSQWWSTYPNHYLEAKVQWYYQAELAFYGGSLAMLMVWEERRRDFYVMLTHHILTVVLIFLSYQGGFGRVGAVVLLLHDPSDVCLEVAKLSDYLDLEYTATFSFALLTLSWFFLRLVVLPFWVIRSAMFELPSIAGGFPGSSRLFTGMLCMLVCMHIYWFALIMRIAWRFITVGDKSDTREEA